MEKMEGSKVANLDISMELEGTRSKQNLTESDSEMGKDEGCMRFCAPETNPLVLSAKLAACVLAGIVFGWALEKSRGKEPYIIMPIHG